ncbi:MAG TPA: hypothetical protein DDW85_07035 [Porphyromonadaceae bacterium]|jgi:hypothetical protein|nr:hypothetical protein [Porphyromonadaceae bacterium]
MKKRYYTYIGILCSLLVFTGCDKDSVTPETGDKVPITLSASSLPALMDIQPQGASSSQGIQTRAETINSRSIGVVAVNTDQTTALSAIDWTGYYLNHVRANGTNTTLKVDEKQVAFVLPQWWPFNPNEYLAFVAYGPHSEGDSRVQRVGATNTLKVTSNTTASFPDFIYTEPVGPWNKETAKANTDKAVSLGEFQHAMAKLDIRVILADKDGKPLAADKYPNPNRIRITKLEVSTVRTGGSFDLLQTPKSWVLNDPLAEAVTVRTHVNSATPITADLSTFSNCFLLPGTHTESYVFIDIQELAATTDTSLNTVSRTAKINEFEVTDGTGGAKLEMGKTTLLTIKVKYVPIPDPEQDIILEGQLVEWDYQGKSTVTIE